MKKIKLSGICILLATFVSCNNHTTEDLIIGTWVSTLNLQNSPKLIFSKSHLLLSMPQPQYNDSMSYKISNDGRILITTEMNGKTEQLEIIEISKNNLTLVRNSKKDTLRLKR